MNIVVTNKEHPNISILKKLNVCNLLRSADLFAEDFIWHSLHSKTFYSHDKYTGLKGLQGFLNKLEALTSRTFQIEPDSITPIGNELVITYVKDKMTLENRAIEPDAVIVWRIVNGHIVEAGSIQNSYR